VTRACLALTCYSVGGLYWAFVVCGILVLGVIGYFLYQYWKRQRALDRAQREAIVSKKTAVQSYEEAKLDAFNKQFQRDLELAAKKQILKLDPNVHKAVQFARQGQRKEVFALIDKGAVDACAEDEFGRSLLMVAAEIGDSRLCDGLLRRGADINQRNKFNGATVLHFAYQFEHDSLGLSLVARGADNSIRAIDGRTCYQLRDDDLDAEDADIEAPAPRRDMNAAAAAGKKRKDTSHSRRNSAGHDKMGDKRGTYDKMGDKRVAYDKMGDPTDEYSRADYPHGMVPGPTPQKYRMPQKETYIN